MENNKIVSTILYIEECSFLDPVNELHTYNKLYIKGLIDNEEVSISLKCFNPLDKRDLKRIINRLREVN